MGGDFSVTNRSPGHWDVSNGERREFMIRGEPGSVTVTDERNQVFKSLQAAMAWICDEYMIETKP